MTFSRQHFFKKYLIQKILPVINIININSFYNNLDILYKKLTNLFTRSNKLINS